MSEIKWYAAALVVSSFVDGAPAVKPFVDFQVRLIQATDPEAAYAAALRLGLGEQSTYKNAIGETVRWQFEGLHDLREIGASPPSNGTEVFNLRSGNSVDELLVTKEQLSVFWEEANKGKRVVAVLLDKE